MLKRLHNLMTHRATLGTDPRGNLTRIDNALALMPQRLEAVSYTHLGGTGGGRQPAGGFVSDQRYYLSSYPTL